MLGQRWEKECLVSVETGGGLRVEFEEGFTSRTTEMCVTFVWVTTQGDLVA